MFDHGHEDAKQELSELESRNQAVGDTPGSPTWPIRPPDAPDGVAAPSIGLSWQIVADRLHADRGGLEHDGLIVLTGEYFPEAGFFLDPETLLARQVDVGDMALRDGYFLGDLAVSNLGLRLPLNRDVRVISNPVIKQPGGQVVGVFRDLDRAQRAKHLILRGGLGAGVSTANSGGFTELRVRRPYLAGRVATVMASLGGAVIPHTSHRSTSGPMATGSPLPGDALRGGTGAMSDSGGPEVPGRATEVNEKGEFTSS